MSDDPARVAVIDIGSNSTRMLVANVEDGRAEEVDRRTRVTRLARGVDLTGRLSNEAVEAGRDTGSDHVNRFEELGAGPAAVIATSAVRDADNGEAFMAELRERFALSPRILDGDEEAALTYRGATSDKTPTEPTLVIDIGGGAAALVGGRH